MYRFFARAIVPMLLVAILAFSTTEVRADANSSAVKPYGAIDTPATTAMRGGFEFGGSNRTMKGGLDTSFGNSSSGRRNLTDPAFNFYLNFLFPQLAMSGAFGNMVPFIMFNAAYNAGGYSKLAKAIFHGGAVTDSFLRFRRGFQAGLGLGMLIALTNPGICGFGTGAGCMDLALWAGPMFAIMSLQTVTNENFGGGNLNRFRSNQTLFGAMIGARLSYQLCAAACLLPTFLTLAGQLNITENPHNVGGTTQPFGLNYKGGFNPGLEAILWIGLAMQLNNLFTPQTAR